MRFCIESRYFSIADGGCRSVSMANTTEELLHQLREAIERPGWSNSVLVNAEALPSHVAETWRERATSQSDGKQ